MFTSGTQELQGRTVNHDPEPYVWADGSRETEEFLQEEPDARLYVEHEPRPEFEVTDNPILAGFRDAMHSGEYEADRLATLWISLIQQGYRFAQDVGPNSEAHREHARKVLARLAARGDTRDE